MPVERVHWIYRAMVRAEPETLFVFGDNLVRRGMGGQAREIRGERNAVGLPTKRTPRTGDDAYFTDADLDQVIEVTQADVMRLIEHVTKGGTIVWPADGIGTGRAELPERAPQIATFYDDLLKALESVKWVQE